MRGSLWLLRFFERKSEMKKPSFMKKDRRKAVSSVTGALTWAILCAFFLSFPALASSSAITGKINNLYDLVLGIIKAAGAIVLAWGVFEFAAGYQSHDSAQQTQSLKKVISGILMCGASTVISLVK